MLYTPKGCLSASSDFKVSARASTTTPMSYLDAATRQLSVCARVVTVDAALPGQGYIHLKRTSRTSLDSVTSTIGRVLPPADSRGCGI